MEPRKPAASETEPQWSSGPSGPPGPSGQAAPRYVFKLYVTGRTPRSERAIANLQRICDSALAGRYELSVIDVLEQPHLAEQDRILATPTLVKQVPPPARRVLGDLTDVEQVLWGLDVHDVHDVRGAQGAAHAQHAQGAFGSRDLGGASGASGAGGER
jgi:circadian clock protein KaiB